MRQFATQRASANDSETHRQRRYLKDRRARAITRLIEAWNVGDDRTRPRGDKRLFEMHRGVADKERIRAPKPSGAEKNVDTKRGEFVNRMIFRYARANPAHARHHLAKFESGLYWNWRAKFFSILHRAIDARGADDGLGWHRPDIERISTQAIAFDERNGESEPRGGFRRGQPRRACSDNHQIVGVSRRRVFPIFGAHAPQEGFFVVGRDSWGAVLHR